MLKLFTRAPWTRILRNVLYNHLPARYVPNLLISHIFYAAVRLKNGMRTLEWIEWVIYKYFG